MIICNTTFSVPKHLQIEFVKFMREVYVPSAIKNSIIKEPRLSRVHAENVEGGYSYAFEFKTEDIEQLEKWNTEVGKDLYKSILIEFQQNIPGFTTVLQPIKL